MNTTTASLKARLEAAREANRDTRPEWVRRADARRLPVKELGR